MILSPHVIQRIKPEFGDRNQIETVRHYSDLRNGIKPVVCSADAWGRDDDADEFELGSYVHAEFVCPVCLKLHTVYLEETSGVDEVRFVLDSNYCVHCETEFEFHDDSEFKLYVKPD